VYYKNLIKYTDLKLPTRHPFHPNRVDENKPVVLDAKTTITLIKNSLLKSKKGIKKAHEHQVEVVKECLMAAESTDKLKHMFQCTLSIPKHNAQLLTDQLVKNELVSRDGVINKDLVTSIQLKIKPKHERYLELSKNQIKRISKVA